MFTVALMYALAVLATSGALICVGRCNGQGSSPSNGSGTTNGCRDLLFRPDEFDDGDLNADAGVAIRQVLRQLTPMIASKSVQIDYAAPIGVAVKMRAAVLAEILEDVITTVVNLAPASRILLTAVARGDRVYVSVADDIPNANEDLRRASLRGLTERIAPRGASLNVIVQPHEGTIVTLRLAAGDIDLRSMAPIDQADEAGLTSGAVYQLRYDPLISM